MFPCSVTDSDVLLHRHREGLRSKEQELAAYGVTWTTDLADEEELARELQAARRRRLAGLSAVMPAEPPPRLSSEDRLRWAMGTLLIRAGKRLQGGLLVGAAP